MIKTNKNSLLKRAEEQFVNGEYHRSLRSYGLILKDHPELGEAKVGVYLSDLGLDSEDDAQALFDYYQVIKTEQDDAAEIIDNLIHTLDNSKNSLQELLIDPLKEQADYEDGIRYKDFMLIVDSRGSFKQAFEDIMFSTKVVIANRDEFIDFIKHLSSEGFRDMALNYLDAASGTFGDDQEIYALYHAVGGESK
ncbi:MAG: hypothetical protein DRG30_05475 [Epsilonproteobacteria bacterium]|nr:MAG: hypothetical protein DRG30_05475 [Campylobacterota bacterium]